MPAKPVWSGVGGGEDLGAPSCTSLGLCSVLPPHLLLLRPELQTQGPSGLHEAGAGISLAALQGSQNLWGKGTLPPAPSFREEGGLQRSGNLPGPTVRGLGSALGSSAPPRPGRSCSCGGPCPTQKTRGLLPTALLPQAARQAQKVPSTHWASSSSE